MNSKKIRRILASNRRSGESIKDTARRIVVTVEHFYAYEVRTWLDRKGCRP